jgi:hypothetical protein
MKMKFLSTAALVAASVMCVAGEFNYSGGVDAVQGLKGICYHLAVGDLNKDGKEDILVSLWPNGVHAFFQNDGKFPSTPDWTFDHDRVCNGVIIKDLDGDNVNDLAIYSHIPRTVFLFSGKNNLKDPEKLVNGNTGNSGLLTVKLAEGEYTFLSGPGLRSMMKDGKFANGYVCGPKNNDNAAVTAIDINNDDNTDLIFVGNVNPSIRIYGGPINPVGMLVPAAAKFFYELNTEKKLLWQVPPAVIDINSDGRLDIVFAAKEGVFAFIQQSPCEFSNDQKPELLFSQAADQLYAVDLDNDKRNDLVLMSGSKAYIFSAAKAIKGKKLDEADRILEASPGHAFTVLTFKDVNLDGLCDIVAAQAKGQETKTVTFYQEKDNSKADGKDVSR